MPFGDPPPCALPHHHHGCLIPSRDPLFPPVTPTALEIDLELAELEAIWTEQRNQDAREGGDITYCNGVLKGLAEARRRLIGEE